VKGENIANREEEAARNDTRKEWTRYKSGVYEMVEYFYSVTTTTTTAVAKFL